MQLKEVDINGNAKMLALNMMKGDINKMNTFEFKKMFMADKMYTVIKDLDSWLKNSFNALRYSLLCALKASVLNPSGSKKAIIFIIP